MTRRSPALRMIERNERRQMASIVTIARPGGAVEGDAGEVDYPADTVYSGRADVFRDDTTSLPASYGSGATSVTRWVVVVPRGADVQRKDVVTVDACPDPSIVGLKLRVTAAGDGEFITNRRLGCEVTS